MPLPDSLIDSLFARLQVRYGAAWVAMWNGIDIDAVKADWADELAGFASAPGAIRHGLDHLPPDRPPNVAQFRALCRNRPDYAAPALAAPKATEADRLRVRQMLAGLKDKFTRGAA